MSINYNTISYIGKYSSDDPSEKVYKYKFDLYYLGELVETSDWLLHSDESIGQSSDVFSIEKNLEKDKYYQLIYTV
jgi:hypothetical protein